MIRSLFVAFLLLPALFFGWYEFTGGFSQEELLAATEKGISEGSAPLGRYHFLGAGRQSFAFLSEDGSHVLKLFRGRILSRSPVAKCLPPLQMFSALRFYSGKEEASRMRRTFFALELAWKKNRDNGALLALHLAKTSDPRTEVVLVDRVGRECVIDPNEHVWLLQERVEMTKERLLSRLDQGDRPGLERDLEALFALYRSEYSRGLYDRDHNLLINTGFVGERAVRLDLGKLREDERYVQEEVWREDWRRIVDKKLSPWLKKHKSG